MELRKFIVFTMFLLLFGCSSSQVIRYQYQDDCARVVVPLVLASKQSDDHRGGNVQIWRVYLSCKTIGSKDSGDLTYINMEVGVVFKGFVDKSGEPYTIDMPYVILVKDQIADEILGKVVGKTEVFIEREEKSNQSEVFHSIEIEYDKTRKNIYPTVFVGLQLSEGGWRRYRQVIQDTGERALISD